MKGFAKDSPTTSTLPPAPVTRMGDEVDDYHGTKVPDPYRWLEDADSTETRAWVDAQNARTRAYLTGNKHVDGFRKRLTQVWNYERLDAPSKEASYYYYTRNTGLQNQSPIYRRASLRGPEELVIDPNKLSSDATVALGSWEVSRDGRYFGYMTAASGSDWNEAHVIDLQTSQTLKDHLKWAKYSGITWDAKGEGFFYNRFPEPKGPALAEVTYYQKVYYHKVGTEQKDDVVVYERPDDKEIGFGVQVTDDLRYLVVAFSHGTDVRNGLGYAELKEDVPATNDVVRLLDEREAMYEFVGNVGKTFYLLTNFKAPRGRVVAFDVDRPGKDAWREVVPESEDVIEEDSVTLVQEQLIVRKLRDAHSVVLRYDLQGKLLGEIPLPAIGTTSGFHARRQDTEVFFVFQSPTHPPSVYRYDVAANRVEMFFEPKVPFEPEEYVTTQTFATSKDGTRVPMFVTHKKGLELNGKIPTRLYAYGGFNITETPVFRVTNLPWLERGGLFVAAALRGGGEYGEAWHKAGMLENKQNVFDDFIAAAEWLIENDYCSSSTLGIEGGSNGGLLVGAVMTQRPDLFAAAAPAVGVLDMLRFHKYTIGWAWVPEYGSADDAKMFPHLLKYSPLHNVKPGQRYPAMMAFTADHDDRVVPAHSYKFTAAMQAAQAGERPVLIRIDVKAGHGAGKPTNKRIEEAADRLAFFAQELGME